MGIVEDDAASAFSPLDLPLPLLLVIVGVWLFAYMARSNEVAESNLGWTVVPWVVSFAVYLGYMVLS